MKGLLRSRVLIHGVLHQSSLCHFWMFFLWTGLMSAIEGVCIFSVVSSSMGINSSVSSMVGVPGRSGNVCEFHITSHLLC